MVACGASSKVFSQILSPAADVSYLPRRTWRGKHSSTWPAVALWRASQIKETQGVL